MKLIGCVWRWIPLFAMSLLGLGEVVAAVTRIEGLTYAQYGTRELQLDLFIPENHEQKMPAIVCIHGGGWWQGNRKSFHAVAATLAERGYVAAAISYRLSGEAPFPAAIQDCKAAVRWLRANAESYSINPRFIGAIGHSAGGHLAALLATSGGVADLEGEGGNARFSSSIQAAVPGGAQSDLETDRIRSMTAQSGAKIWHDFLGGSLDENEANYQRASPRRYIDASDPPLMFITGGLDNMDTQAVPLRDDMSRLKIPVGLFVIPDAPHGFLREKKWFDITIDVADLFFSTYLKEQEKKR